MALKLKVNFLGVDIDGAYIYVSQFRGNKTSLTAQISFCASSDKAQSFQIKEYTAPYALESENPIKQVYAHLKTLEEFFGSVDC